MIFDRFLADEITTKSAILGRLWSTYTAQGTAIDHRKHGWGLANIAQFMSTWRREVSNRFFPSFTAHKRYSDCTK